MTLTDQIAALREIADQLDRGTISADPAIRQPPPLKVLLRSTADLLSALAALGPRIAESFPTQDFGYCAVCEEPCARRPGDEIPSKHAEDCWLRDLLALIGPPEEAPR